MRFLLYNVSTDYCDQCSLHLVTILLSVINYYIFSVINYYIFSVINYNIFSIINYYILSVINYYIFSVNNAVKFALKGRFKFCRRLFRYLCNALGEWEGPRCMKTVCDLIDVTYMNLYECTDGTNVGSFCVLTCPLTQVCTLV